MNISIWNNPMEPNQTIKTASLCCPCCGQPIKIILPLEMATCGMQEEIDYYKALSMQMWKEVKRLRNLESLIVSSTVPSSAKPCP